MANIFFFVKHKKHKNPREQCRLDSPLFQMTTSENCRIWLLSAFKKQQDPSLWTWVAAQPSDVIDRKFPLLGQGRHTKAWLLSPNRRLATGAHPQLPGIVYKRIISDHRPIGLEHWISKMKVLQTMTMTTLLPPIELVVSLKAAGYVMPYANSLIPQNQITAMGLQKEVADLDKSLLSHGLELEDVPQIGWCHEVPMLYDLGDINWRSC